MHTSVLKINTVYIKAVADCATRQRTSVVYWLASYDYEADLQLMVTGRNMYSAVRISHLHRQSIKHVYKVTTIHIQCIYAIFLYYYTLYYIIMQKYRHQRVHKTVLRRLKL